MIAGAESKIRVVFAHTEHVEPNLISDLDLFEKIGHAIGSESGLPVVGSRRIAAKLSIPISMTGLFQRLVPVCTDRTLSYSFVIARTVVREVTPPKPRAFLKRHASDRASSIPVETD
jgi:hypothetical protein